MPVIRKAYPADFQLVLPLLHEFKNADFTDSEWQKLFRIYWQREEEHIGYVMLENETPIGFMGLIFSDRFINGNKEKFCGLSSWIVTEQFRHHSLLMLVTMLNDLKKYTITNFTPIPEADTIFRKLKWKYFEEAVYKIAPGSGSQTKIEYVNESNVQLLDEINQRIFNDHKQFAGEHILIYIKDKPVYVVLLKQPMSLHRFVTNKLITYSNALFHKFTRKSLLHRPLLLHRIAYSSNYQLLIPELKALAGFLKQHKNSQGVLLDSRFTTSQPADSKKTDIIKLLYSSTHLLPKDIDALYTEAFTLQNRDNN